MSRPDPNALFDAKHRSVVTICDFNAVCWQVPESDCDDVRQNALMQLWRSCVRACDPSIPLFTISATIIVLTALRQWHQRQRRNRVVLSTAERLDVNPAPSDELTIVEDGVRITLTRNEARAEAGDLLDLWNNGYTGPEVARRLGVSRQHVYRIRSRFGAVLVTTGELRRWRFPREQIDAEAARRRALTDERDVPNIRARV